MEEFIEDWLKRIGESEDKGLFIRDNPIPWELWSPEPVRQFGIKKPLQ